MTFFINAWLERENPILELRECSTNRMVYRLEGETLNEWLNNGELTASDLNNCKYTHSVIRNLLLKSITKESIKEDFVEDKKNAKSNNVINFSNKFKTSSKENNNIKRTNNIVYLFSIFNQRFLNQLNNAIY
ncbi:MAG: hypothetical protein AB8B92_00375 [Gammaproteobacteria bacterium]